MAVLAGRPWRRGPRPGLHFLLERPGSLSYNPTPVPAPCVSVRVCACVSTGLARPLPGVATQPDPLSQPLFKRFTQTRWAAPQQTLEEIVSAVAERMPEFSELQDCFREVRGCWAAGWGHAGRRVCAHTRMCFLLWPPPLPGPWPSGRWWVPMALPAHPPRSSWRRSTCTW